MSVTLIQNVPQVNVGLVTYTYTIPTAATGIYSVHFEATELPPTGLVVLVKQGSTTRFTMPTPGATQSQVKFDFAYKYTAADVVTVVMTGSGNDNLYNSVKSICSIQLGEN